MNKPNPNPNHAMSSPVDQLQEYAIAIVYFFCKILTTPVEMALRPHYGSRYFSPVVLVFSGATLIVIVIFSETITAVSRMLPFVRYQGPVGMFGLGMLLKLFFLGSFLHGLRIWQRMLHMEREINSYYEGNALPFFRLFRCSFWTTRILLEPLFLLSMSIILPNIFIFQDSAAHYLAFVACMLFLKNYISWYLRWEYLRNIMDAQSIGPIVARIVQNRASDDDFATIQLTSAKNLPDDLRREFATHVAKAYNPEGQTNDQT